MQDWAKPVKKLVETLERWQKRHLTVCGKAVLIKTYGLATISYLASIFPLPDQVASNIHKIIFQFLWNKKNELISRATCHLPFREGGLGIPDLHLAAQALLAKWIRTITDSNRDAIWIRYGRYWTGLSLGLIKPGWAWLRSNLTPHRDPNNIPTWYMIVINMAQTYRARQANIEQQQLPTRTFMSWQADYREPRCVGERRCYVRTPIDMVTKWEFLWASAANNRTKETIWKLMHRVLSTKSYIACWGVCINTRCPYCPGREDIHHTLIGCNRAHRLWEQLQPMLTRIAGSRIPILVDTLALANHLPNNAEMKALCFYLLTLAYDKTVTKRSGRKSIRNVTYTNN